MITSSVARVMVLSAFCCVAVLWDLVGADEPLRASIWGRTIASEPYERVPFREIRVPEWVQETVGVGYTLSVQNAEQRQRAVKAGVTISEMGFVDPFHVFYESKLLKRRSPHVALDSVDKEVAEYRRLGLRILGVYPPTLQSEVYAEHPDWRRVPTNTTEIPQVDLKQHPYGGMLCLLGPYSDFFIEVLAEIVEKYQVDAFSFDGLHYAGVCYCQHCRENFLRDTKSEIPNADLNDAAFRRYQHWADRRMEDVIRRMQTRLKAIKPDVALVTWTTNAGRFGHYRDLPRNMPARMNLLLDAPDQEFWLDETNRGATIVPALANAYIWACTNHRVAFSEPYLMSHGNPYGKDSFPAHEVLQRVLLAATHGASPSLAVIQPEHMQKGAYDALAEVQRRKPWLTHKRPEPWGAMLLSDNTRTFYGRSSGQVEDRYLAHVFGTYRAILEEHLPVTVTCDWNLNADDLAGQKVLILPNAASMTDVQAAAIREFVRNGGGLVASLDTSLCNEFGDPRPDFALADVFGVHHSGSTKTATTPGAPDETAQSAAAARSDLDINFARNLDDDYWLKRKNVFALRVPTDSVLSSDKLRELIGSASVTFKGPLLSMRISDGTSLAAQAAPHNLPDAAPTPAIVTRQFGKGRVVYFAAGIDHAYYSYAYPYQRVLLANAIRWAANSTPPVEIGAPRCVQSTVFRQKKDGQTRLLVHLYNDVNTTAFHGLPNDDVPLREETLSIHDIRLSLRGFHIQRATQQPEARPLTLAIEGESTVITVPRLEVHSVIVLDMASSE